jgi:hypothetical protein
MKKQTQSAPALMDVKSFVKEDYEIKSRAGLRENKANLSPRDQTQFQSPRSDSAVAFEQERSQRKRLDTQKS